MTGTQGQGEESKDDPGDAPCRARECAQFTSAVSLIVCVIGNAESELIMARGRRPFLILNFDYQDYVSWAVKPTNHIFARSLGEAVRNLRTVLSATATLLAAPHCKPTLRRKGRGRGRDMQCRKGSQSTSLFLTRPLLGAISTVELSLAREDQTGGSTMSFGVVAMPPRKTT